MSKRTFILFGLLIVVLAAVIPWLVFESKGDAQNGAQEVSANLQQGQTLFQTNCGTCHSLYAAGTDGNYGPDLDELLATSGPTEGDKTVEGRVLSAIENGIDGSTTPGRMPPGILNDAQAEEVAAFVAAVAGRG